MNVRPEGGAGVGFLSGAANHTGNTGAAAVWSGEGGIKLLALGRGRRGCWGCAVGSLAWFWTKGRACGTPREEVWELGELAMRGP